MIAPRLEIERGELSGFHAVIFDLATDVVLWITDSYRTREEAERSALVLMIHNLGEPTMNEEPNACFACDLLAIAESLRRVRSRIRHLVDVDDPAVDGFNDPWVVLIHADDIADALADIAGRMGAREAASREDTTPAPTASDGTAKRA
jgi:hypothetical protein